MHIDPSLFFTNFELPDFIASQLQNDDWYLSCGLLVTLLNKHFGEDKITIHPSATIHPTCVVEGPCYIGEDVVIGPHVYIRPGSIICDHVSIGHASEVKNSLVMPYAKIANHCFCGDSILGKSARMGGHSETANRRFDQQNIVIIFGEQKYTTELSHMGSVIGEGARLGGGVIASPGTLIGKNTFVSSGGVVSGYLDPNSFVKVKLQQEVVPNSFIGELKP